jgi:DNA-directed RNA polymerase specialized sigma24 family protein
MHWLRCRETQEDQNTSLTKMEELEVAFAEQLEVAFAEQNDRKQSLYRTALMITGNPEIAEQSIVDAAGLAETASSGFRDWLVQWAHSATARAAANAVRSSIRENAAQYADWTCSHRRHKPLSPAETRTLHRLDVYEVIQRLDVLARAVLVLYGCQRVSPSECALLLNVPLRSVVDAYCRAMQWHSEIVQPADKIRRLELPLLRLIRHDPDGVPVWGQAYGLAKRA